MTAVPTQNSAPTSRRRLAMICAAAVVAAGLSAVNLPPASAAVLTPLQVGPRANATRVDFTVGARADATVDVGTGNLLVTTTELTLPGIAADVQLGMDFNSLLLGAGSPLPAGAGGKGWAMRVGQDTKLVANTDGTVLYLAPGGLEGLYTPISGTSNYTSPAGFKNTLVKTGTTGWTLTDHGSRAVSTFDAAGVLTTVTDRNAQPTTLSYAGGKITSITSTRGGTSSRTATMTFTGGLLTAMAQHSDSAPSRAVSYGYNTTTQHLTSITDTAGQKTTLSWNAATGDLASISDPSSTVVAFTYDTTHRVTSVTKGPVSGVQATTRFTYPTATQTLVAGPNTNQSQAVSVVPHITYTLDGTERVTSAVDELGMTRSATYTPFTDVATTTTAAGGLTSTTHTANAGESLTSVTSPTGSTAALAYTPGANAFAPSSATDPQGNPAVLTYDGAGNPASTANSTTAAVASVAYRPDGTLLSSTDPASQVTTYGQDPTTHQITSITPPAGSGLGATTLTWDTYSRLGSVTDGKGTTLTYTYTNLDQVAALAYSDGTATISYTYNSSGQVKTRTDGGGTVTYGYNARDNLLTRTATTGGGTLSYGYDLAGNLTSSTNAGGTTAYTYNSANQLTSTTPPGGALTGYAYNNDGRRTDTWWKTNTTHTTFAAHTHTDFDAAGRVGRTWTARNNLDTTRVFDTTYCYTANTGAPCPTSTNTTNPTKTLIQWSLDNLGGARSIYSYDGANRLTAVTNYGGHNYTYAYDVNGNRTSTTVDAVITQALTFNAGNQITNPGYSFNNAGQQTHAPTNGTLTYNGTGQMTTQTGTTTSSTYTYAGTGQDELLTQNLTAGDSYTFVYGRTSDHGTPVLDSMVKNGSVNYFDNDPTGTPLAIHLSGGQADFYVMDGNGTPVALIDGTGTQTGTYTYDPYGTQTSATGTGTAFDINPYRHTTGIIDRATGFIKHGTRWNDTTTGRWTTTDPITRLADPNNANTYTYAADNPINFTDPTGRDVYGAIAAAICGVAGIGFGLIGVLPGLVIGIGCTIIGVGDALTS